jgi:hypothetical protein
MAKVSRVPENETKREKTIRLVNGRVVAALQKVHIIGNCASSAYEYNSDDVDNIESAILAELDTVINKLRDNLKSGGGKDKKAFNFTLN